ncbi:hypothetical protein ABIE65_000993 [Constrictibacter sp. MBR-5]|jgi:hypothetical protein|uniref:hypothetical protein n=1 Tax=Constrictibacter sp. MBR-5 TaxID=3156467 RepID=UPI003391AEA1
MDVIQHPASTMILCISPAGDLLVPGSATFNERIGYQNPDFDIGDYAVRNMGFVAVSRIGTDVYKLRFRPELLSGKAVEAMTRFIAVRDARTIELEVFTDSWRSEIHPNDHTAAQRIYQLCAAPPATQNRSRQRFEVTPLAIETATGDFGNPMKPIFQKWRISSGKFDDTTLPFVMRYGLSLRLTIVAAKTRSSPLCFQFVSDEVKLFDAPTKNTLVGRPILDQPDKEFANWIAPHYDEAVQAGTSRLDVIGATVAKPGGGQRRISYERMLLPWRHGQDGIIVTSTVVMLSTERESLANDNKPRLVSSK